MKILFIGGIGNISWPCTAEALDQGHEVWILNRAQSRVTRRAPPAGVKEITVDIRDLTAARQALADHEFDVVADFICFDAQHARNGIELFAGKTKQFIFVSSEAIYQRKPEYLPFKDDTPQHAPDTACGYIDGKVKAEAAFLQAHRENGFPAAIIRPGYTYDTIVPVSLGHNCFTAPQRALDGKPFLIGGDGENRWAFTHSFDFARAFTALLGKPEIVGDAVHITSDFVYSWNDATRILAEALHLKTPKLLHIPREIVLASSFGAQKEVAESRLTESVFDTSKIKSLAPGWRAEISLEEGLRRTLDWLYEDRRRVRIVPHVDQALEELERSYGNP